MIINPFVYRKSKAASLYVQFKFSWSCYQNEIYSKGGWESAPLGWQESE
jgi:hypothetical protein